MHQPEPIVSFSRRQFMKTTGMLVALSLAGASNTVCSRGKNMKITIKDVDSNFEREPLIRPFGFKGGYMTEIWQTMAYLQSERGTGKVGLCTQNVLWSDAKVFASHSESGGNALMYALTERALQIAKGMSFRTPVELLDNILEEVYEHGKSITGNSHLRKTFALNALVGVDNAAWLLYAQENGIKNFDNLIPAAYKPALSHHHKMVASIPLMAYSLPISEMKEVAGQ